jgi:hypothetical protein
MERKQKADQYISLAVGVTPVRDTCSYPTGNSRAFLRPGLEEKTQDVSQFVFVFTVESVILSLFQWFT